MSTAPEWLSATPIAHRGLHGRGIPENGLGSIEAARERGYAVEIDVFLSKDGVPMVIHDEDLTRSTGLSAKVSDLTAHELGTLRLFGTNEGVPTLSQALAVAGTRAPLLVEIKPVAGLRDLTRAVCEALDEGGTPAAVMSFHPAVLDWMRRNRPRIPRGLLGGTPNDPELNMSLLQRALVTTMPLTAVAMPNFLAIELRHLDSVFTRGWRTLFRGPMLAYTVTTTDERDAAMRHADNMIFEGFLP